MLGTPRLIIMMNKFQQMSGETSSIDFNVADQFSALLVDGYSINNDFMVCF